MTALPKSKAEAKRVGAVFYMTGAPCKNGHVAPRRTSNRLCVECGKNQCRRWYARNTELAKARAAHSKRADPIRAKANYRRFVAKHRLEINLERRLAEVAKRRNPGLYTKAAIQFLGCSLDEFRTHLESQFQPGMTWDNWGRQGWHIDHIRPLLHFDLKDEAQLRTVCHYTNLQPLWWRDNIVKSHVERGHIIRGGR